MEMMFKYCSITIIIIINDFYCVTKKYTSNPLEKIAFNTMIVLWFYMIV